MPITQYWPQIVYIALIFINFTVVSINDGKPRGNYNSRMTFVDNMILGWLLYMGGFFK